MPKPDVLRPSSGDDLLFHYTTLSTALEHILPTRRLRMGRFRNTSDPRESKDWNFGVTTSGTNASSGSGIDSRVWDAADQVQDSLRLICLSEDDISDGHDTPVEKRGFGLSMMWDRYGDRHRGVCLALDRNALGLAVENATQDGQPFQIAPVWKCRVKYRVLQEEETRPEWDVDGDAAAENPEAGVRRHVAQHYHPLLFCKSSDWRAEREYRWVYLAEAGAEEIYVPIADSLRAVFLGFQIGRVVGSPYNSGFREVCQSVPVYEMNWKWGHFQHPRVV